MTIKIYGGLNLSFRLNSKYIELLFVQTRAAHIQVEKV